MTDWLRRWWPALAPASASLACAAVMVSQQIEARELRASNQELARQIEVVEASTASSAARPVQSGNQATVPSAAEQEEISRLKERVLQLGSEIARLEAIQKENASLRTQAATAAGLSADELAALEGARTKAQSIACINHLKQIGLAVLIWANDNKDVYPPNFLTVSNELNTPKLLVCPADTNRIAATSFANYTEANCSYEYLAPNATSADFDPHRVLTHCPIHGHVGLFDGSVHGEVAKKQPERLVMKDKKLYLESYVDGPVPQKRIAR